MWRRFNLEQRRHVKGAVGNRPPPVLSGAGPQPYARHFAVIAYTKRPDELNSLYREDISVVLRGAGARGASSKMDRVLTPR
jgi:hypothetical protein